MVQYRCPKCDRMVTPDAGFRADMLGKPCRNCQLGRLPPRVRERPQRNTGRLAAQIILILFLLGGAVTLLVGLMGSKLVAIVGGVLLGLGILLGLIRLRDRDDEILRR